MSPHSGWQSLAQGELSAANGTLRTVIIIVLPNTKGRDPRVPLRFTGATICHPLRGFIERFDQVASWIRLK